MVSNFDHSSIFVVRWRMVCTNIALFFHLSTQSTLQCFTTTHSLTHHRAMEAALQLTKPTGGTEEGSLWCPRTLQHKTLESIEPPIP